MPSPRQPQPRARRSTQCVFREDGRQCRRNAIRGGLCGSHQDAVDDRQVSPLADLIDRIFHGEAVPRATLEQLATDAMSRILGRRVSLEELQRQAEEQGIEIDWDSYIESIRDRVSSAYSQVSSRVRSSSGGRTPPDPQERARREQAKAQAKEKNRKERERASHVSRARRILGYTAKEPITKDQIKLRQRELARKHHPDRGGSVERMQDINWAVDILLGPA